VVTVNMTSAIPTCGDESTGNPPSASLLLFQLHAPALLMAKGTNRVDLKSRACWEITCQKTYGGEWRITIFKTAYRRN
jgi:hypothetical protein